VVTDSGAHSLEPWPRRFLRGCCTRCVGMLRQGTHEGRTPTAVADRCVHCSVMLICLNWESQPSFLSPLMASLFTAPHPPTHPPTPPPPPPPSHPQNPQAPWCGVLSVTRCATTLLWTSSGCCRRRSAAWSSHTASHAASCQVCVGAGVVCQGGTGPGEGLRVCEIATKWLARIDTVGRGVCGGLCGRLYVMS